MAKTLVSKMLHAIMSYLLWFSVDWTEKPLLVFLAKEIYDYSNWKACEYYEDVDSPYNTYHHEGLPPSPIMNPGEHAIEAVLYPADSEYYFFIGDVYGDGGTIFAKTYSEHLKNIDKYLK